MTRRNSIKALLGVTALVLVPSLCATSNKKETGNEKFLRMIKQGGYYENETFIIDRPVELNLTELLSKDVHFTNCTFIKTFGEGHYINIPLFSSNYKMGITNSWFFSSMDEYHKSNLENLDLISLTKLKEIMKEK